MFDVGTLFFYANPDYRSTVVYCTVRVVLVFGFVDGVGWQSWVVWLFFFFSFFFSSVFGYWVGGCVRVWGLYDVMCVFVRVCVCESV